MIKLYYKIVWENRKVIFTYIGIFLGLFLMFNALSAQLYGTTSQVYEQKKAKVSIINHDESEISKIIVQQLEKEHEVQDLGEDMTSLKDALFFAQIDTIIEIPKNFEVDYENGKENLIQLQQRPDDANGILIKQKLNSYLSSIQAYKSVNAQLSYEEIGKFITNDLDKKAEINFMKTEKNRKYDQMRTMYFNFLSYVLFSIIVMSAGAAMHSIYRSEMLKRTLISPINNTYMNIRIVLANMTFGFALWAVFAIIILISRNENMFTSSGLIYLINSFLFTLVSISFAYMATTIVSNKKNGVNKLDMITSIFGLSSSFLGGAFLPIMFIPDNILQISKFIPTYWYVKTNELLTTVVHVSNDTIKESMQNMGIQFLFAITFLAIGLVIMKSRRSQDVIIDNDFE